MAASIRRQFSCSKTQLCLDTVLVCGQSFRWKKNSKGEWLGVMAGLVWRLNQTEGCISYQVYSPQTTIQSASSELVKYAGKRVKNVKPVRKAAPTYHSSGLKDIKFETLDIKLEASCENDCSKEKEMEVMNSVNVDESKLALRSVRKRSGTNVDKLKAKVSRKEQGSKSHCFTDSIISSQNLESNKTSIKKERQKDQETETLEYEQTEISPDKHWKLLEDYFQLGINLDELYVHWSSRDAHFSKVAGNFHGIRILRQEPVENLISFVCSSNNHISRISSMVEKLCMHYGDFIATVDGEDYYAFPELSSLCGDDVESRLRELGFGYRAKFIASIAKHICHEKEKGWLNSLRGRSYPEAKAELMTLLGVGAKVADCVCLMSLDQPGALPVDTHVWQITMKNYMAKLQTAKSLTDRLYSEIGDFFRDLWGPYAGWAHSVLFTADLRHNKDKGKGKTTTDTKAVKNSTKKQKKI